MKPKPLTKDDLQRGADLVQHMHDGHGYDEWAEIAAKALSEAYECGRQDSFELSE